MISVITPCLNEEKHIITFFNSLLAQTFKDFEVIIIDGGSTDLTLRIIAQYFNVFTALGIEIKVIINETRNFGYLRNLGASHAIGDIMFHCNTDNYLPPNFLEDLDNFYRKNIQTLSVSGRVYPIGTSIIAHIAYQLFDLLRFVFTCAPIPIKKYRPSGSFISIRTSTFREVGGFPHVTVNEDGLLGQKLDTYTKSNHKAVAFNIRLWVGHHVKKFEEMGGIQALLFYFYTLANFAPMLKPLLEPIKRNAGLFFEGKPKSQIGFKTLFTLFWDWL